MRTLATPPIARTGWPARSVAQHGMDTLQAARRRPANQAGRPSLARCAARDVVAGVCRHSNACGTPLLALEAHRAIGGSAKVRNSL